LSVGFLLLAGVDPDRFWLDLTDVDLGSTSDFWMGLFVDVDSVCLALSVDLDRICLGGDNSVSTLTSFSIIGSSMISNAVGLIRARGLKVCAVASRLEVKG
jgi:hypothetical protein